mmetsp:Transcript_15847/g.42636  ORF Transcript_15847/g.42636 Transcript_15847/m.42636 type:complete len:258 (-) Transcript_15847:187-960(-)
MKSTTLPPAAAVVLLLTGSATSFRPSPGRPRELLTCSAGQRAGVISVRVKHHAADSFTAALGPRSWRRDGVPAVLRAPRGTRSGVHGMAMREEGHSPLPQEQGDQPPQQPLAREVDSEDSVARPNQQRTALPPLSTAPVPEGLPPPPGAESRPSVGLELWLIDFYKDWISPLLPRACRFVPTCSSYGKQAYAEFGAGKGFVLTAWRIMRCNPLGGSGFDPPQWPPPPWGTGSTSWWRETPFWPADDEREEQGGGRRR